MDDKIGRTIGNYVVMKKLGQGQFGNVYLVQSKADNQEYALKCIDKKVPSSQ